MKNTRAIVVLVLALLTGLVAAVMAARWLSQKSGDGQVVVVASRDVSLGTPLDGTMLTTIPWPGSAVPVGAANNTKDLEGRVLKAGITRGEPVLEAKLAPKGSRGGLSAIISPGKRAITVRVNEVMGVAGFALPGSFVDVMVHTTLDDEKRGKGGMAISKIVLERIPVLAVAQEASRDETKPKVVNAVTLEVTPEQAQMLDVARSVGSLSLVLRNQIDGASTVKTEGTGKDALFPDQAAAFTAASAPTAKPAPVRSAAPPVAKAPPKLAAEPAPPDLTKIEVIRGVSRSTVEM